MDTSLEATVRYLLIAMFIFIAFGNFMNLAASPQAYLLCFKLAGSSASAYLLANGLASILLIWLIVKESMFTWCAASLLYFGFHLANSVVISLTIFKAPAFSLISLIGLILSLIPLLRGLARR